MSTSISLERVAPDTVIVLERLWQLYRHDLSEFRISMVPEADGTYPLRHLPDYLDHPDHTAYLLHPAADDDRPIGFALLAGLETGPRSIHEFFVVRALRGRGVGYDAAVELLSRHPGTWEIAFQEENPAAARFWRRIIADTADTWHEERHPVPGTPELPPDVVITFDANKVSASSR
jgi:predicted acetyltransferase